MNISRSLILASLLLSSLTSFAEESKDTKKSDKPEYTWDCKASREFVATYEYLKSKKEFGMKPNDMRSVALTVTKGCTGAASAFISATELLVKAGIDTKSAVEQARDLAVKGEQYSKAFVSIFRGAFAKEFLDLDTGSAIKIARKLTTDFNGDPEIAADDYFSIAKYCVGNKGLDLPRPECAMLAARIAGYSENSKLPVYKPFIKAIEYLTKSSEVNLAIRDALPLAESLVSVSPEAVDNFRGAFEYASDKSGLELGRADAITFAKSVALNTRQLKPL